MDKENNRRGSHTLLERKGAIRICDIMEEVRLLLQEGKLQSVNLTEWLSVNHLLLLKNVLIEFGLESESGSILQRLEQLNETKVMKLIPAIAKEWLILIEQDEKAAHIFDRLSAHSSDSVRCWAAYIIGLDARSDLQQKLKAIRIFAADLHFGVREIAWMALRQPIAEDLKRALDLLSVWVIDPDPNIRRFAVELTRPQGVWAKHIQELKLNPAMAISLLAPVMSDPSKYVQDSVGNWLNDASKTNPDWVKRICSDWLDRSDTKATHRITARAQRSMMSNK
ncbi:DNA alkylation repair protein [Paenibacillus paridis]|uniref:DNA alkylation repair protein n=1 Tax=Paenibacillus paridis TaxID=2583376 RepID=UPI0011209058|nr:DNA alkylation repair protein [Paenibacillus paridis]